MKFLNNLNFITIDGEKVTGLRRTKDVILFLLFIISFIAALLIDDIWVASLSAQNTTLFGFALVFTIGTIGLFIISIIFGDRIKVTDHEPETE